jgi:hypothetical protein
VVGARMKKRGDGASVLIGNQHSRAAVWDEVHSGPDTGRVSLTLISNNGRSSPAQWDLFILLGMSMGILGTRLRTHAK